MLRAAIDSSLRLPAATTTTTTNANTINMTSYTSTRSTHPPFIWYANGSQVPEEAQGALNVPDVINTVYTKLERVGPTLYHPTTWEECKEYLVAKKGSSGNRLALIMTISVEGPGDVSIVSPTLGVSIKLNKEGM
jgi:hypothetical protein